MTRIKFFSLGLFLVLALILINFNETQKALAASFDYTRLAEDSAFINVDALNVDQIQDILKKNGSFLKNYSQDGRSAAQIIYDAAHGYGDASGTASGIKVKNTINPAAILAMLQKEQSLITMSNKNDSSLRVAMGYACPDSGGCDDKYYGFTNQVENASWQLRYNYERASGEGFSSYQVGKSEIIDGKKIKIANRATSALYRYTPHLGTNFTTFFNKYNGGGTASGGTYNAVFSKIKASPKNLVVKPGQKFSVKIEVKNTGTAIWSRLGNNAVKLGTQDPQDGPSVFLSGGNRINMSSGTVKPKKKAKFSVMMVAPTEPGVYTIKLKPVAEGIAWFGPEKVITVTVK